MPSTGVVGTGTQMSGNPTNQALIGFFAACSVICCDSPMKVPRDMLDDAGRDMKARLRADLRNAMKDRRTIEAKVIRALIAAIDNAEAPPVHEGQTALARHHFHGGSAKIKRLLRSLPVGIDV
jgi:hypothetical protein